MAAPLILFRAGATILEGYSQRKASITIANRFTAMGSYSNIAGNRLLQGQVGMFSDNMKTFQMLNGGIIFDKGMYLPRINIGYGSLGKRGITLKNRYILGGTESYNVLDELLFKYKNLLMFGNGKGKGGIIGLSKVIGGGIQSAGSNVRFSIDIDTSSFDAAMNEYVKYSRKTAKEIVNAKAFGIVTKAYKYTHSVDKQKIKEDLSKPSEKNPKLRVADMVAITKARKEGKKITNVKTMGNKLINVKASHVKSLKRTWLPAINDIAPMVGRTGVKGLKYGSGFGKPELRETDMATAVVASVLDYMNGKVDKHLHEGFQMAFNLEAVSMQQYVQNKIDRLNNQFNSRR